MTPEHKPSDLDLWARACERVGKWKRGATEADWTWQPDADDPKNRYGEGRMVLGRHRPVDCPPIGDAECVVAMEAWVIAQKWQIVIGPRADEHMGIWDYFCRIEESEYFGAPTEISLAGGKTHQLALAAAVVAVPKEPDHAE